MRTMQHWDGFLGGLAGLVMIAFIGLVAYLIVRAISKKTIPAPPSTHPGGPSPQFPSVPQMPDAMRILDERLARGDIEITDYMTRRQALLGQFPQSQPEQPIDPTKVLP